MKMGNPEPLDLTVAAARFAALGSEQRLAVLRALVPAGPEGLTIGQLGEHTGVHGSTLTHHLKILSSSGLVKQTRQGRNIICAAVAYKKVQELSGCLIRECCADSAEGSKEHFHG
jgi:DNA-binding transcriptional ArsR family regulator